MPSDTDTRIVLRGDGYFANPELMQFALDDPHTDFIFGLAGNSVLSRFAQPLHEATRKQHEIRCENARRTQGTIPHSTRTYHEVDYAS